MLRFIFILNAFCVYFVSSMYVFNPGPKYPPTKGELWPKAQVQTKYDTYYNLVPSDLKFNVKGQDCQILQTAIERYKNVLKSLKDIADKHPKFEAASSSSDPKHLGTIKELQINLSFKTPCEEYPYMDMDEQYTLDVAAVSTLNSKSIWGILRGLESFAQLFYISDDYENIFINTTNIEDFPRHPYRGLLIDTGRHFLTMENILKTLDAMEMNKMNVLHWHIVDDQAFPYQSEKYPELSAKGAFDVTMIYTRNDVKKVIDYARDRGIRVIPEIDVPGHSRSWGQAFPDILTKCYKYNRMIGLGLMDPTNNATFNIIGELFKEVQDLFPDKYFHVGGDEVDLECWSSNPDVKEFMKKNNIPDTKHLLKYFMTQVMPLLKQNSIPVAWQDVFDNGVEISKDTIIEVWRSYKPDDMVKVLEAGYKLIHSSWWYLDQLKNGGDWVDYYTADPRKMVDDNKKGLKLENIVGGEACMWGEVVDDRNIMSRVWPRGSAVAERLWSPQLRSKYAPDEAYHRIEEHTCRMIRRGIPAQPASGPGVCFTG
ncbi:beta-hexosaminidase subunit beta-like [Anticarsia gemmatalis]|uniref:beta-hexosaminidase subunit beta-like n=1 Tax=Anticarsia gemmatalis TaxID=129554 RepID=UPI003F76567F